MAHGPGIMVNKQEPILYEYSVPLAIWFMVMISLEGSTKIDYAICSSRGSVVLEQVFLGHIVNKQIILVGDPLLYF